MESNYNEFLKLCLEKQCKFTQRELKEEVEKLKFAPLIAFHKGQKVVFGDKIEADEVRLHIPSSIMRILLEFESYFNNLCNTNIKFDYSIENGSVNFDVNKYIQEYGYEHIYIILGILIVCGFYYLKHLEKMEIIKQEAKTNRNNTNNEEKLVEKCLTMIDNEHCKKIIESTNYYQKHVIPNYETAQKELGEVYYCDKNFTKQELAAIKEHNLKIEQETKTGETREIVDLKVYKPIVNKSKSKKWDVGLLQNGIEVTKFIVNMSDSDFQNYINNNDIKPNIIKTLLITKEITDINGKIKYEYVTDSVYVLNETIKIKDIPSDIENYYSAKNNKENDLLSYYK